MNDTWAEDKMNFTSNILDQFDSVTQNTGFHGPGTEQVYFDMLEKMPNIAFGEYLKRYIYRKTAMNEVYEGKQYDEIPLKDYQLTIKDSFSEYSTPPSFTPTTAKLSALSKNWLTQKTVKRNVVFLLGFGLGMDVDEVNTALTKWLRERKMNPKNAFEVICWYCYAHGYRYPKFEQLYQRYIEIEPGQTVAYWSEKTGITVTRVTMIHDDASLLSYVGNLKLSSGKTLRSVTVEDCFERLYEEARSVIAALHNTLESERVETQVSELWDRLSRSDRLSDYEKQLRVDRLRAGKRIYTSEDITESDFEQILCAAVPKDKNGNLTPARASSLNDQFSGYRFSRQHIGELRKGNAEITRFDLLTLKFFLYSQRLDDFPNEKIRFYRFTQDCDSMLAECSMGELYIQNPYECFLLICMLADDPLGTYADVVERSYE